MATTIERFALLLEVLGAAQATREIRGLGQASKVAGRETDALESAQNDLTKSLNREKDSLGQVRAAEAKLAELRGDAKAKTSQVVAAEERLAKAQRQSVSASRDVTAAQARLTAEQRRAKDAATDLGKEQTRAAKGVGTAWKVGAGILAAGALAKMVQLSGRAIESASKLEQSVGGVRSVFGASAKDIEAWSEEAADGAGLAKSEFNDFATRLGASLKNSGVKNFAQQTNQLIRLGSDLSATFGGTVAEAIEALGAGLRGESDPLERYGVLLSESAVSAELAARGQGKLQGAAADQAKIQARLGLIFKQTTDAQGAFAREAGTLAGQQARAAAEAENMRATLGEKLLPIQLQLTESFVEAAPAIQAVASAFGAVVENDVARWALLGGAAMVVLAKGVDVVKGSLDTLGVSADEAEKSTGGLRGRLSDVGVTAQRVAVGVGALTAAAEGLAIATDIQGRRQEEANKRQGEAAAQIQAWTAARKLGILVGGEAQAQIDREVAAMREFIDAQGLAGKSVEEVVAAFRAMNGAGRSAVKAKQDLTATARVLGVELGGVTVAMLREKTAGEQLGLVMDKLTGVTRTELGANIAWRDSLASLDGTLKENRDEVGRRSKALSLDTEVGRQNRSALLSAAQAAEAHAQAVADETGSVDKGNRTLRAHRDQLVAQLRPYLGSEEAARQYVDEVLRVPKEVRTKVTTPGSAKSRGEVKSLRLELAKLNDRSVKVGVQFFTNQGHRKGANTKSGGIIFAADGGPVPKDAGAPGKDSVHAMLMPGEFVLRKSAVDKYGVDALEHLNAGRYADGGLVAKQLRVAMASRGRAQTMARADRYVTNSAANILSRYTLAGPGAWGAYSPWARTSWTGQTVSQRTAAMLRAVSALTGSGVPLSQGSWSTRVAASAGTHAGGGVVDVSSRAATTAVQSAMRRVGFAAWIRTPSQGPWGRHIHAVAIGDPSLSGPAKRQAASFLGGGSGLARGYDQGGWLPRGLSLAYNGTGRPERVLPPGEGGSVVINGPITVVANDPQALVTALRKEVRLRGGDVQAVLGR